MAKIDGVQEVAIADLTPYERNAKLHDADQVEKIANSIQEFGFLNPILIDKDKNIIAGHGRVMAAKHLGLESVPAVFVEGLSDAQRRAYILADNKLTELGGWDMELVNLELAELAQMDFDVALTGFDFDINTDMENHEIIEDDFSEELPEEPKAKRGDIYQLGKHRLMCGDSTNQADVARLMNGQKAKLIHTDPPYGVNMSRSSAILNDDLNIDDLQELIDKAIYNAAIHSEKDAPLYCWIGFRGYSIAEAAIKKHFKINNCIVWVKPSIGLGGAGYRLQHELCIFSGKIENKSLSDVWECKRDKSGLHPTIKPIELVTKALINSSKQNDLVLDLFGGSGSTLIACEQTKRKCYMMELDPKYIDVIINRWETLTGEKAILLSSEED